MNKKDIRIFIKKNTESFIKNLSNDEYENLIKKLYLNLSSMSFPKKSSIAAFYPMKNEINIISILKNLKEKEFSISLPFTHSDNKLSFHSWNIDMKLKPDHYGILSPDKKSEGIYPDIYLVPLVAFDEHCGRLGNGKGIYDRHFSSLSKSAILIGIAFEIQKCNKIPISDHDALLDFVVTEKTIYKRT